MPEPETGNQESAAAPAERPFTAGEGGRLPMGLALFRFFLFGFLMLGAVYGGASLYRGGPPPRGLVTPGGVLPATWEPSPVWFPSFLTIKAGMGVTRLSSGYAFRGPLGYAFYGAAAITIGILLGGAVGWLVGEAARRHVIRRRERYLTARYGMKVQIRE